LKGDLVIFVVYSTRALAFVALNQPDEPERFANAAMSETAGDRRIKHVELLMVLGQPRVFLKSSCRS
jgi:hypothetical protein